jgi:hypothetical protein
MAPHRTLRQPRHTGEPGPRDGLDSGSVAELVADGRAMHLDVSRARPWPRQHHDIAVPTAAPSLLEGFGSYGS